MNVRLKRHLDGTVRVSYARLEDRGQPRLAVECETIHPKSAVGRRVWMFLDDEDVTALLLELRAAAVIARR